MLIIYCNAENCEGGVMEPVKSSYVQSEQYNCPVCYNSVRLTVANSFMGEENENNN